MSFDYPAGEYARCLRMVVPTVNVIGDLKIGCLCRYIHAGASPFFRSNETKWNSARVARDSLALGDDLWTKLLLDKVY